MNGIAPRLTDKQLCAGLRLLTADPEFLAEYARRAADRIEALQREVHQAHRDAQDEVRGAATESYWHGKQDAAGDYGSY